MPVLVGMETAKTQLCVSVGVLEGVGQPGAPCAQPALGIMERDSLDESHLKK